MKFKNYIHEAQGQEFQLIDEFGVVERYFSEDENGLNVGLANIHALVPNIDYNKDKIYRALSIFKDRGVNMAIFPEFCLAGYFWNDEGKEECWRYMDKAVIEEHANWVKRIENDVLDDTLQFFIFNNIRTGPAGQRKYYNTTYIVHKDLDYFSDEWMYDKTFLPGIENTYTVSGKTDRVVLDTQWGRFGFTTCYDFCFSQLYQEYARVDNIDAVIQMASWRGTARRDYPGVNVYTDTYYGDLWDMLMDGTAARNQIWVISANAVGVHAISQAKFWGGSGLWAPSGLKISQASHDNDELLIMKNVQIKEEKQKEKDDFDYAVDFGKIYKQIEGKRAFTRL